MAVLLKTIIAHVGANRHNTIRVQCFNGIITLLDVINIHRAADAGNIQNALNIAIQVWIFP